MPGRAAREPVTLHYADEPSPAPAPPWLRLLHVFHLTATAGDSDGDGLPEAGESRLDASVVVVFELVD